MAHDGLSWPMDGRRIWPMTFRHLTTGSAGLVIGVALSAAPQESRPTFSSESELVVLHVAVRDRKGGYVGGLGQDAFRVLEDKRAQPISFFNSQDSPVTVGLLIDSSGSMSPHRDMVITAAMAFSKAMNPADEFFVLGFNENIHAPLPAERPFTQSEPVLRVALVQAMGARGQTAVYDAVNAGLQYVQKGGYERQVLIVLSDGGDNASGTTRAGVLTNAQASNAVIYSIALVDPMDSDADPGFLSQLSEITGGVAFRPRSPAEINAMLQKIAVDIRNMYTLGYVPANSVRTNRDRRSDLRRVAVEVRTPAGEKLAVRTRRAYLDGAQAEEAARDGQ